MGKNYGDPIKRVSLPNLLSIMAATGVVVFIIMTYSPDEYLCTFNKG